MKRAVILFVLALTTSLFIACKETKKSDRNSTEASVLTTAEQNSNAETDDATTNDNRVNNAGKAKSPKGKMSYVVNGSPITIDENKVQCMYISMNGSMAQAVISGGNQCGIVHMGLPKLGDVQVKSKGGVPTVSIRVMVDGVDYLSTKSDNLKFAITKITPDGNNWYVAGTFSGTLTTADGSKTITVTDGVFESAYL